MPKVVSSTSLKIVEFGKKGISFSSHAENEIRAVKNTHKPVLIHPFVSFYFLPKLKFESVQKRFFKT